MEAEGEWDRENVREWSLKVVVRADKCQESTLTSEVPTACLVCLSACIDSLLHWAYNRWLTELQSCMREILFLPTLRMKQMLSAFALFPCCRLQKHCLKTRSKFLSVWSHKFHVVFFFKEQLQRCLSPAHIHPLILCLVTANYLLLLQTHIFN